MDKTFDLIVAGGGVAALVAAARAADLGHRTLLLGGSMPGGLLLSIERVEGLPGLPDGIAGYDLCPILQEQAAAAGVESSADDLLRVESVDSEWKVHTPRAAHRTRTLIVATGARLRTLDVPGEAALLGKGVSHCASCDGPLLRGRPVLVVGSGDSAMQEALHLAGHVSKVTMLHRGSEPDGQQHYRDRVLAEPRIEHRFGVTVSAILGRDAVTGVRLRSIEDGSESEAEASAVFVYVGLEPNSEVVREWADCDEQGRILVDASMRTASRGLLAAGSVRSGTSGQAVGAAGDGATAAFAVDRYLSRQIWN